MCSMDDMIRHDGIVLSVGDNTARVRIVQSSACSACKARRMCMSAESQTKEMDVTPLEPLHVGDEVEVLVQPKLGWKAVGLAYILPFIVLISAVFMLGRWLDETIAGIIALCAIGVYYWVLSFFKRRLQREFSFTAKRKQSV